MSKDPFQEALDKFERAGISLESKSGYEYGIEDGITKEHERIIKLIEELADGINFIPGIHELSTSEIVRYVALLIKGENK